MVTTMGVIILLSFNQKKVSANDRGPVDTNHHKLMNTRRENTARQSLPPHLSHIDNPYTATVIHNCTQVTSKVIFASTITTTTSGIANNGSPVQHKN